MGKKKKCPACGMQVDSELQHCPNCPHSFFQDDGVQQYRKGRSRQHYLWAVGVVVFFLGAYKLLNFVIKFADADDTSYSPIRQAAEQITSTSTAVRTAGLPGAPDAPKTEEERTREEVQRAVSHGRVQIVSDAAGSASEPDSPQAPAPPASGDRVAGSGGVTIIGGSRADDEARAKEWRLRGCVYDLVTLKPVPHATLVIKDAELNRRFELVTGLDGRYRTTVPSLPNRGYVVAVEHADYAQTYLDPATPDVRRTSAAERRQLAQELTHALDAPYAVQGGRKPVVTDYYLAPRR